MERTVKLPVRIATYVLAAAMVAVGAMHFIEPEPFVRIMPPWLPWHLELVYLSGVFEIAGGLGLLVTRTRRLAALGLIALFVAVFPANIHMALNGVQLDPANPMPEWIAWARLPFQFVFIAWAWWIARAAARKGGD